MCGLTALPIPPRGRNTGDHASAVKGHNCCSSTHVSRKRNEKPSRGAVSWSVWRTCVLESLALSVAALLIRTFQPNPCFWDDVNSRDYFILDRRFPKRSSTPLRRRWSVFQRGPHTAPSMGSSPETLVGFLLTGTLWNAVLRPSPNQSERVLPPTPSRLWAHAVAVCSLYKQLLFYHWNFGFFQCSCVLYR